MNQYGLKLLILLSNESISIQKIASKNRKCCTYVVPLFGRQRATIKGFTMATVKIVIRKKKNKDDTFPLALRITKDRKSSFIYLGHNLEAKYWDDTKGRVRNIHPNSTRLNNFIEKKRLEVEDNLLQLEAQKNDVSSKAIKNSLKLPKEATFFKQTAIYLENLEKAGKFNRLSAEKPLINRFKEFLKGEDISFQEITIPLLNKYKAYIKGTRKVREQTVINHLVVIRTMFNQAIASNLVDPKYYPFGRNKVTANCLSSNKIGLSVEEVKQIEEVDLSNDPGLNHARNVWLFAFYFAGMRVSDVFRVKWSDFQNDRLYYTMGKNAKGGSFKVPEKVHALLDQYRKQPNAHELVFPELSYIADLKDLYQVQRHIALSVKRINFALIKVMKKAGIDKPVTMHIARHTFGNISGDRISVQMLQKLYRHSSITTTVRYQANFIHKDADDALDAVIGF